MSKYSFLNGLLVLAVIGVLSLLYIVLKDAGYLGYHIEQKNTWASFTYGTGTVSIRRNQDVIYFDAYDFQRETQDSINKARYALAEEFIKTMPSNTTP